MNLFSLSFVILNCLYLSSAIRFFVSPTGGKKCLKEEIHKNVLVTGEYDISEAPGQKASIQVTDSKAHVLYQKDDISKGKFAFTTEEYEMFDVCVETKLIGGGKGQDREVMLDIKHGVETKNYDSLAQAEKLKPLEVELKRLEDLSDEIVKDFQYMRDREEKMRDTNESTHNRVFYFSLFSMACLMGLAVWQVLYLRRYFKSKKLIE